MAIALQLYTVRNELARDFEGTLRRVRDLGYRNVEAYPFPPDVSNTRAAEALNNLGLRVIAMHNDLPLGPALDGILETASALDCRRLIWHGWPKPPEYESMAGLLDLASRYNQAWREMKNSGLELGLHNHWWEFEPLSGSIPFRVLHEQLDPAIFFEIDTYWVRSAGADPATVLKEFQPRVKMLHLKDGSTIQGEPMTALGRGRMDFAPIFRALPPDHRVDFVVELDECAGDIYEAIESSLASLNSWQIE